MSAQKINFYGVEIPLEQQEARYHEHEPKSKRLWDLTLWKKKGKFSGKHGETAERFMAAKTIKANTLHYAPIEKAQEKGKMLDLQDKSVNINDVKKMKIKYDQHHVKFLPIDEVEL